MVLSKYFPRLTFFLFILAGVHIQANAESTMDKANRLIDEKKYTEAVKILEDPSLVSNGEAQFSLYVAYEYGKGVTVDRNQAFHRLLMSAYLRYPPALEALSIFADHGHLGIQGSETAKVFWESEYYRLIDQE